MSDWKSRSGEANDVGTYTPNASSDASGQEVGITPRACRVAENIDPERQDVYSIIRRAMLLIEEGDTTKGTGPYRAIVVETMDVPGAVKPDETGDPTFVVRARIPELHSSYPIPIDANDLQAIRIYPTFVPRDSVAAASKPKVGDIVMVDYGNREHLEDGVFLSIITKKSMETMKGPQPINRGACGGDLKNLHNDINNEVRPLGVSKTYLPGEMVMEVGYHKGLKQDILLVEWGGKLVSPEMATKLDQLKILAGQNSPSIVTIVVVSGFRTMEEQQDKYDRWLLPENDPRKFHTAGVARPGTSNHQMGNAVDLEVKGHGIDGYAWLAENAPKVGLRTLSSIYEPWHWELPGN